MRKWKDNENIKLKHSKVYLGCAIFILIMSFLDFTVFHWDYRDILNVGIALFLIWGVKFNGFYKIARYIAEQSTRRKDNKFRYFSK